MYPQVTGKPANEDIVAVQSPFAITMLASLPPPKPKKATEVGELLDILCTHCLNIYTVAFSTCESPGCRFVAKAPPIQSRETNHGRGSVETSILSSVP